MKIGLGARGKEVRDIQSRLMKLDYDLGMTRADGVFGKRTEEAVKNFQARVGLAPSGMVDEITWQKLFEESLSLGERLLYLHFPYFKGNDVRELQSKLVNLGFNPGPVDGVLGPKTERALKEFQQSVGLIADGICGPETLAFLERYEGRPRKKGEIPTYPLREILPPFPPELKIAFFVNLRNLVEAEGRDYLLSLTDRLSKIFNAWGIPCYFLENLSRDFKEEELLLSFEVLKSGGNFSTELLIEYPVEGLRVQEGKKLAELIFKKLQQRFPSLIRVSVLGEKRKTQPAKVLNVSFVFTFQRSSPLIFSESEETQQRLAGAITEGIKDYFAWKQKQE